MLVDAEHAFDPAYSKALGVDVENLIVCQPDHGEMALESNISFPIHMVSYEKWDVKIWNLNAIIMEFIVYVLESYWLIKTWLFQLQTVCADLVL